MAVRTGTRARFWAAVAGGMLLGWTVRRLASAPDRLHLLLLAAASAVLVWALFSEPAAAVSSDLGAGRSPPLPRPFAGEGNPEPPGE